MKKQLFISLIFCLIGLNTFAQKTNNPAKLLYNLDKETGKMCLKSDDESALKDIITDKTILFRPNPISAKEFFANPSNKTKNLTWEPSFVQVSRNLDWAFTTGEFTLNEEKKKYGQYLSVWKKIKNKWTLDLDLSIDHPKPLKKVEAKLIDPKEGIKAYLPTESNNTKGKEIISSTELVLNASLKTYGPAAFVEFLNEDSRLLFPGNEPILKKGDILSFNNRMIEKMTLKTSSIDRANGGDLAYSYGIATIDYKKMDLKENFYYVFIWEAQANHRWDIIAQIFVPAER
ncbi:MAG: nuclear transport factor 2 family protein [Sphingobacteriaceae bacterium]|nr:nuclear transport factor 2 family protein [Sphingobacteriaceae bacterium]